ncbi:MAG TPA: hypothetical protein VN795_08435 [Stellaceae bacterium]|nr:hypothetical protein [Stellaceae bacterium]
MRVKIMAALLAAIFSLLLGFHASDALAQAAPPWGPGGGTVDPKDPNHWTNPKDGPNGSDYVWDAKICRWVFKNAGQDKLGNHKAGDLEGQGPPTGATIDKGSLGDKATNPTTGDTFTWDEDVPPPGKPNDPPVPGSGKGWVNNKTKKSLCTPPPPAAVAPAPGGIKQQQPEWRFSGALGGTLLIPNVMVGWQGTGTGGTLNTTFNTVQVMPTVELDVWHPITNSGLALGASGNLMFPFQGTYSKTVSNGTNSGMETFKQGLAGSAYFNVGAPVSSTIDYLYGEPHSYDFSSLRYKPEAFWYIGAGLAVDQYKAGAVFPGAGDFFGATHTDVVPAFQVGVVGKVPFADRFLSLTGQVQDFLPGSTVTMPGGNSVSYGTVKAGNTVGVTLKAGMPF